MKRGNLVSVRLTDKEMAELQKSAVKAGLSVSDIIRLRLFKRRVHVL